MSQPSSNIILGTVQFGLDYGINNSMGQMPIEEVFKILDTAGESGIKTLDTAAAYGNSEERIGFYLKKNPNRQFKIITKFDLKNSQTPLESLNKSLQRLQQRQVDTIMFHNFDDYKNIKEDDFDAFLKEKGKKFKRLGISVYTNSQIESVCNDNFFDVIQLPFNVLDNQVLRGECLKMLKEKGLEVHTRSVFLQGLFMMEINQIPDHLKPLIPYLLKINDIADQYKVEKTSLMFQYALKNTHIDGLLIGVDSEYQLKQNLQLVKASIPQEALDAINEIKVQETSLLNPATWKI